MIKCTFDICNMFKIELHLIFQEKCYKLYSHFTLHLIGLTSLLIKKDANENCHIRLLKLKKNVIYIIYIYIYVALLIFQHYQINTKIFS
jgi:ABC-type transport system involved in cytochrome c biogenesis permease subunit